MSTATVFLVLLTLIVIGVCVFVIARTVGKNRGINVVSDTSTENPPTTETEVTTSTEEPTTVVPFTFPTTETPVEPTSSPHIDTSTPPTLTPTVTTTVPPTEPTDTPTVTPTDTPTVTPTDTPTITPTETPIPTMDRVYFGVAPQPIDFLSEVIGSDQSKCTLSYYVPEVIVEGAPAISEKIKSQCVARIDRIIEEINDSYNAEDVHGEESFFIKYLYFKSSKNTVSVIFTYPIFAGKAGGTVNRVRSLNVDIRTGESVDLNSFITDSRQFSSSIRSALLETGADNINANVMNYKAWYIDGTNGLTVMFNPGTVVPTAYSIISVKVSEGYSEPD